MDESLLNNSNSIPRRAFRKLKRKSNYTHESALSVLVHNEQNNDHNNKHKQQCYASLTRCKNNDDEALKLIHTSVLPAFRSNLPQSPWLKFDIPAAGYKCVDCGDVFLLDTSLKQHLERRSLNIHFPCDVCKVSLVYYNRCSLLAHIRLHNKKNQKVDVTRSVVTPLSKELLISNLVSPTAQRGSTCSAILSQMSRDNDSNDTAKISRFRCAECLRHFDSLDAREMHFNGCHGNLSPCVKCGMICPSRCSLKAHSRIHSKILPYVCPECGEQCPSDWGTFTAHLEARCYHFARSMSYNCFLCDASHMTSTALQKHVLKAHTKVYVKCQACPMAFKGPAAFEYHKQAVHTASDARSRTILKCPLCNAVFNAKEPLLQHLLAHINDKVSHSQYVFRCSKCAAVHKSKYVLLAHVEAMHGKSTDVSNNPTTTDKSCNVTESNSEKQDVEQQPTLQTMAKKEEEQQEEFEDCPICNEKFPTERLLMEHEQRHLRDGLLVCMLCHSSDFLREKEFETHLDEHIDWMHFPETCSLCECTLTDSMGARRHIRKDHLVSVANGDVTSSRSSSIERSDSAVATETTLGSKKYECPKCPKKMLMKQVLHRHMAECHANDDLPLATDSKLPPIKIRIPLQLVREQEELKIESNGAAGIKQELNIEEVVEKTTHDDCSSEPPARKLRIYADGGENSTSGSYVCAKCDFLCIEATEFRQHILAHKKDDASLQCVECGTCFVVEPSLRKHLVVAHRVRDVESYLRRVQTYLETSNVTCCAIGDNLWQCRVCRCTFDNESALKFHMRSHGMAFIRSKALFTAGPNTTPIDSLKC